MHLILGAEGAQFLSEAFEELSQPFHGYRDALISLRTTHTSAGAQPEGPGGRPATEFARLERPTALNAKFCGPDGVNGDRVTLVVDCPRQTTVA
jgi:hypothetical protein